MQIVSEFIETQPWYYVVAGGIVALYVLTIIYAFVIALLAVLSSRILGKGSGLEKVFDACLSPARPIFKPLIWTWKWVAAIPLRYRKVQFRKVFNFKLQPSLDVIGAQGAVDLKLRNLAQAYATACSDEIRCQKHTVHKVTGALARATKDVAKCKDQYWYAHGLAESMGFRVKRSHEDYLRFTS